MHLYILQIFVFKLYFKIRHRILHSTHTSWFESRFYVTLCALKMIKDTEQSDRLQKLQNNKLDKSEITYNYFALVL